ncbi:uncharacterized protein LOC132708000 isoform X2 [Cylas formicarius]|uniref:uncharacterized protein LOC132708000 isoform X2 n=1 Tax=Cylas formicarius TaxID=197179 RepID=UPI002958DC6F|nr:uncharacterized protein LOC132708000 isoform X2 [Cylas formicarius]
MRAGFQKEDYIVQNFFLALSVSHDIYDDVNVAVKNMVVRYYLKAINDKSHTRKEYQRSKLQLLQRMQYRTFVQKKICKNIISLIPHKFMERNRHELHAGAFNESNKVLCKKCLLPIRKSKEVEQRNSTVLNKHSR